MCALDNPIYNYTLPDELIAHVAAEPRDSARLLVWPEEREHVFRDLPELLEAGDVLVVNASKVIPARLYGVRRAREAGGRDVAVEFLLHRPLGGGLVRWQVFAKPLRRLRVGDRVELDGGAVAVVEAVEGQASILLVNSDQCTVNRDEPWDVAGYLEAHGHTPLPPYIVAADTAAVRARYQTVYANPATPGSVAAPTAGLHFTDEVFAALKAKGVEVAEVTLHVGAGTFLNPTPEQIAEGKLHAEWAEVTAETAAKLKAAKARGGKVIAVGTTALRTLETWGAMGMPEGGFAGETTLFIRPGRFEFSVVDRLVTNFHLPGSSLLMLVAAFIGEEALERLYGRAIREKFRFYSFGDSSLLTRYTE